MQKNKKLLLTAAVSAVILFGGISPALAAGTVSGGSSNTASGDYSSISGGMGNTTSGDESSVSGGEYNTASAQSSSVSGGQRNMASGKYSSVSGGYSNTASGDYSSVFGGFGNTASGYKSFGHGISDNSKDSDSEDSDDIHIHGGSIPGIEFSYVNSAVLSEELNTTNSQYSSVVDSSGNNASGENSSALSVNIPGVTVVSGGAYNTASGDTASVFGGYSNTATGSQSSVLGGSGSVVQGQFSTGIAGGSSSTDAENGLAAGYQSLVTVANGTAVGYQATTNKEGTIAFGHDNGDVSGYTVTWKQRTDTDSSGNIIKNADGTTNDYTQAPTITENKYTSTYYNRLVKIADGVDDHDAVTVEQLNKAVAGAGGGVSYTAGSDIDISSANAISVKKAGTIASGDTGLVTGGTVYSTTNALNTQINTTSQEVEKLSDKISTYGKTITSISSSVTSAISNMKNNQANFVDTSLSNISTDGRDVIKQVVRDVLAANTASTASTTASAKANLLKTSFMVAPMRAPASLSAGDHVTISGNTISVDADGTVASGDTGLVTGGTVYDAIKDKADKAYVDEGLAKKADISYVDQGLSQKVNVSDFTPVKQQVETNTTDISALKTGKADIDGSNINVGSFTAKLNTGKVEKGNTGLVSGGTVYESLQTKADVGYVNTMGLALDSEIKGTAQGLHNEIQDMGNRLTRDINRIGAGSAALAALHPQDFNPDDKWDFAVGYGHYKNANASAVGAFYRPNAGTTVSLAATVGNGDPQVSAGVSFKIGMGKNVEKVMVNKDDYEKLNRKVESQAVENKEMKEAMNAQNEKIQELEEIVRRLAVK